MAEKARACARRIVDEMVYQLRQEMNCNVPKTEKIQELLDFVEGYICAEYEEDLSVPTR